MTRVFVCVCVCVCVEILNIYKTIFQNIQKRSSIIYDSDGQNRKLKKNADEHNFCSFHLFQRRESEENRKSERRESILTRSDIRLEDASKVKAKRPTTANHAKVIEEVRTKLFQAVEDNDRANVRRAG